MRRKVIQIAESTQLASLPRKWALKYGIKKGDELEIREQANSLVIQTINEADTDRVEINISSLEDQAKKVIGALYKAGYDEISVTFSKTEELRSVQDIIKENLVGFEIVQQGRNQVVVRKISSTITEEFEPILRRCFLILQSIGKDGMDAARNRDYEAMNNLVLIDQSINKFTDFCRRILNKSGFTKVRRVAPFYYILEELEKIGDEYKDISLVLIRKKHLPTKKTLEVWAETNHLFDLFYNLFYSFKLEKIKEIVDHKRTVEERITHLMERQEGTELEILYKLRSILDRIGSMKGPLMTSLL